MEMEFIDFQMELCKIAFILMELNKNKKANKGNKDNKYNNENKEIARFFYSIFSFHLRTF
jgi:hypothetical protein